MTEQSSLHVPGRPNPQVGNPLTVLADAINQQTQTLVAVLNTMAMRQAEHVYALRPANDAGTAWMSYCMACSDTHQRYVYPCQIEEEGTPRPPSGMQVLPTPPTDTTAPQ